MANSYYIVSQELSENYRNIERNYDFQIELN
jgi:hypothetical protein